jgi:hypothetical protein
LTRLIRSLALMTVIKNLGRHISPWSKSTSYGGGEPPCFHCRSSSWPSSYGERPCHISLRRQSPLVGASPSAGPRGARPPATVAAWAELVDRPWRRLAQSLFATGLVPSDRTRRSPAPRVVVVLQDRAAGLQLTTALAISLRVVPQRAPPRARVATGARSGERSGRSHDFWLRLAQIALESGYSGCFPSEAVLGCRLAQLRPKQLLKLLGSCAKWNITVHL